MSKKLEARRERDWWDEPPKPETGAYKFRIESLESASERMPHWPGTSEDHFYSAEYDDITEEIPEYSGKLEEGQTISLAQINALVKEHNLDEKNVFFTASFSDDYLCIEVVNIRELNEVEQLEEYKENYESWAKQKRSNKEQELQNIEWQIQSLKAQAERLKKGE